MNKKYSLEDSVIIESSDSKTDDVIDYDYVDEKSVSLQRFAEDTKLRRELAVWTYELITAWLITTFLLLILSKCIGISNSVLIALLTTTTANVLGLPLVVLKGLFK